MDKDGHLNTYPFAFFDVYFLSFPARMCQEIKASQLKDLSVEMMILGKIVRVGVTFPPELLDDLDRVVSDMGYKSRSKAIHDAVRAFVNEHKWLADVKGRKVGSITMIFNHEMRMVEADLTDTQHQFESLICASMHVHISRDRCLEIIAVKGEAEKIKQLVEKLKARRGVEQVRLNVFSA